MDKFILLIIFYIGYSILSNLIKKGTPKQASKKQLQSKTKGSQNFQAQFEKYFAQVEKRFGDKAPPPLPSQQQQSPKTVSAQKKPQRLKLFPESVPTTTKKKTKPKPARKKIPLAELELPPALEIEHIEEYDDVEVINDIQFSASPSLLSIDARRGYMQGIILSEILGPPKCKRKRV